jgi:pimeloyl-ACP methyl ester carboxylesterase
MAILISNGISIEVEEYGDISGVPLLFIAGLGTQLINWPQDWIKRFVDSGYRVIMFDNRDIGLSQKMDSAPAPEIAYTLDDMADDAIGILDSLGIQSAHVIGKSMGGLILQAAVYRHPERVQSATIIVSTSGARSLPPLFPDIEEALFVDSHEHGDREKIIDATLEADRIWASPKYPFDPAARREMIAKSYDRCHYPAGVSRQASALLHAFGKEARLERHTHPTLVVQGMADTIFPPVHGRDLASRIKDARLLEVDGMGHDLEGEAIRIVFDAIEEHIAS